MELVESHWVGWDGMESEELDTHIRLKTKWPVLLQKLRGVIFAYKKGKLRVH